MGPPDGSFVKDESGLRSKMKLYYNYTLRPEYVVDSLRSFSPRLDCDLLERTSLLYHFNTPDVPAPPQVLMTQNLLSPLKRLGVGDDGGFSSEGTSATHPVYGGRGNHQRRSSYEDGLSDLLDQLNTPQVIALVLQHKDPLKLEALLDQIINEPELLERLRMNPGLLKHLLAKTHVLDSLLQWLRLLERPREQLDLLKRLHQQPGLLKRLRTKPDLFVRLLEEPGILDLHKDLLECPDVLKISQLDRPDLMIRFGYLEHIRTELLLNVGKPVEMLECLLMGLVPAPPPALMTQNLASLHKRLDLPDNFLPFMEIKSGKGIGMVLGVTYTDRATVTRGVFATPQPTDEGFLRVSELNRHSAATNNKVGNLASKDIFMLSVGNDGGFSSEGTSATHTMYGGDNHHRSGTYLATNHKPVVIVDTGAEVNVTGDAAIFAFVHFEPKGFDLRAANGNVMESYFCGYLSHEMFHINYVYFSEDLGPRTIISGPELDLLGYSLKFEEGTCEVRDKGVLVGKGYLVDNKKYLMDYLKIPLSRTPVQRPNVENNVPVPDEPVGPASSVLTTVWTAIRTAVRRFSAYLLKRGGEEAPWRPPV